MSARDTHDGNELLITLISVEDVALHDDAATSAFSSLLRPAHFDLQIQQIRRKLQIIIRSMLSEFLGNSSALSPRGIHKKTTKPEFDDFSNDNDAENKQRQANNANTNGGERQSNVKHDHWVKPPLERRSVTV